MPDADRPPLLRLSWPLVLGFLFAELLFTSAAVAAAVLLCGGGHFEAAPGDGEAAVKAVLQTQAEAWNRGDLDGFMATYWRDDHLTFFSGDTITRGWQATFDRYRKKYQSDGREMGRLEFGDLTVTPLAADTAWARGRWKLTFKDCKTPNGLFTLILRRIDGHWRIVHDHTSTGEPK